MPGDSILIILPRIDSLPPSSNYGVIGDYYKPSELCVTPLLPIENDLITGHLFSSSGGFITQDTLHIDSFKLSYHANGRSLDCKLAVGIDPIHLTKTSPVKVFPNPTSGMFTISAEEAILGIRVLDVNGKVVLHQSNQLGNQVSEIYPIDLAGLENGIYFIAIEFNDRTSTVKRVTKL